MAGRWGAGGRALLTGCFVFINISNVYLLGEVGVDITECYV